MKSLVKVEEIENEGLISFLGNKITVWCIDYIRTGKLVGVNDQFIKLEQAAIIYETGELKAKSYKDLQETGKDMYVMIHAITHFEESKC